MSKNTLRGYRLHDARIAYSGGTDSVRTIKYELKDPDGKDGLRDKIADAIISDNKWLYGNLNLNDYLEWRSAISNEDFEAGKREYSFLGFWLKAISLGFIISNKVELQFKEYLGIKSSQEQYYEQIPKEIQELLIKQKWIEWIDTTVRTSTKAIKHQNSKLKRN